MHDIRTDAPPPRTAIVVGAGIGGLAAAIALRGLGLRVRVLERTAAGAAPAGAGITLWPNALAALDQLGVRAPVASRGRVIEQATLSTPDGRLLSTVPLAAIARDLGPLLAFHRADLYAALLDAAGPDLVETGMHVDSVIDEEDHAGVRLRDGSEHVADVLIGADGVGSVVRTAVAGPVTPRYAGAMSWRGIAALDLPESSVTEAWGAGERFGVVPLSGGRTYWFCTVTGPTSGLTEGAAHADLLRRFGGWQAPIADVLAATDPASIVSTPLTELPWLGAWSHERIAVLGDAAHAMTPNLGQGAAMALEDAVVLGRELGRGRRDVETALDAYAAMRRPRVRRVVGASRRLGGVAQASGPLTVRARDLVVRATPSRVKERQARAFLTFD